MVSVIIPTLNAGEGINSLLTSIKNQTVQCEVVIIDSSSLDSTVEVARSYGAMVISIEKTDFNHGGTRNHAVQSSHGDILIFFTQDAVLYNEHCIEDLIKPLKKDEVAASYGKHIPTEKASPTEKFARLFNYPDKSIIKGREQIPEMGIKTFFFSNVFSAIRRKEFEEMGGFPENVIMFEDMLFAAKLIEGGYKIAYVPEAKVIHSHGNSLVQQLQRYYQAGVSFKENPWFMNYTGSNKEGIAFLREEIKFLFKKKEYMWIPYAILEAMFKYMGYKMGLHYDKLPRFLNKRMFC